MDQCSGRQVVETIQTEPQKERMEKNEDRLRDIWDNIKQNNISIIGVSEEETKGQKTYLKT